MAGKALVDFADFVKATNERQIGDPKDILSDAVKRTYVLADMLKGKGVDQVVQSGTKVTDRVQLTAGSQFEWYAPNQTFAPVNEDSLTKLSAPWRFAKDAWAWTDHEIKLNGDAGGDRFTQFKNLRDSKREACTVSLYNGLEAAMWATPDSTTMETESTLNGRPYSIRCFITDDGLFPSGFTTLMGVASTATKYRNQVANYTISSLDATLIGAFDAAWRKTKFERPDTKEKYWQDTRYNKFKIYTSLDGWGNYVRLTRNANDRTITKDGTYDLGVFSGDPVYGGIPVKYIEELDNAGWTTGQPRFYFLNWDHLFPVFHGERYMFETDPIQGGVGQPYSYVVYKDVWMNLFCRSRYRQGIVAGV